MSIYKGTEFIAGTPDLSGYVTKNTAQTISKEKTFSVSPQVPTPTAGDNSTNVANTRYVAREINNLLSILYPVGSIYIGVQEDCPLKTLISGSTWVKVSEGRVLQGSDSGHNAGTTIAAGLPNVTGDFSIRCVYDNNNQIADHSGAFYSNGDGATNTYQTSYNNSSKRNFKKTSFSASRSNSIYGNSSTVQPPAFVVNIWRRTA